MKSPKQEILNIVKACSIYQNQINNLLRSRQNDLMFLQKDLSLQRIENQLQNDFIQRKISDFKSLIKKEICADLPSAFWNRKQHLVDLPYESSFDEKQIPTKARPIQMNMELEEGFRIQRTHCKVQIPMVLCRLLCK